jgi:hypothetical protein
VAEDIILTGAVPTGRSTGYAVTLALSKPTETTRDVGRALAAGWLCQAPICSDSCCRC